VNKKILISTPFPSLDDVARELGISKSRQKKIEKLVEGIIAARLSEKGVTHRDKDGTVERKHGGARVHALRKPVRGKG
jgi:hypothetical protein